MTLTNYKIVKYITAFDVIDEEYRESLIGREALFFDDTAPAISYHDRKNNINLKIGSILELSYLKAHFSEWDFLFDKIRAVKDPYKVDMLFCPKCPLHQFPYGYYMYVVLLEKLTEVKR